MSKKNKDRRKRWDKSRRIRKMSPADSLTTQHDTTASTSIKKRSIYRILGFASVPSEIASYFLADKLLADISQFWAYTLFLVSTIIVVGIWLWGLTAWIFNKSPLLKKSRLVSISLSTLLLIIFCPSYLDYVINVGGEIPKYSDSSHQVLVHYGIRQNDWMSTNTTVAELEQKPRSPINVNGQDILFVHINDNQIQVDAILFGGYKNKAVSNMPLARTLNFSITLNNYINTDAGPNKNIIRESPGGFIADPETAAQRAKDILAEPIVIKNTRFSHPTTGWKEIKRGSAFEIRNENDIPILVLKYKSPYEMTISGIFVTTFGLLKIDNSEDVIFQFGSNLSDLGIYKVDRVFYTTIFDYFLHPTRTYNLYDIYTGK